MITDCNYSGVITTCNLNTKAPYYVVSYHDGKILLLPLAVKLKQKIIFNLNILKEKDLKNFQKL